MDLGTAEGALMLARKMCATTRTVFELNGLVQALAFLIAIRDADGRPFLEPSAIMVGQMLEFNDAGKETYASTLRALIQRTKSIGIIFIQEAWYVSEASGMSAEDLEKLMSSYPGSLQDVPGRREAVIVSLEHRLIPGAVTFQADITRDSEGKGILGPFEESRSQFQVGRFAGWLQTEN